MEAAQEDSKKKTKKKKKKKVDLHKEMKSTNNTRKYINKDIFEVLISGLFFFFLNCPNVKKIVLTVETKMVIPKRISLSWSNQIFTVTS